MLKAVALLLAVAAATPALAETQVSASPERIAPVALGDARVWNAYVTVTVLRDGAPDTGAAVELRGAAGPVASGSTDGSGSALLPVLSREPATLEVWVDGSDSGKRVELAAGGTGPAPSPATPPPAGLPGGWALGGAAAGIAVLVSVFALFRSRRARP